jgi:carboxypeptidase Q
MKRLFALLVFVFSIVSAVAQPQGAEKIDTLALARIKDEGLNNSRVMEFLEQLCDSYGPRLAWSPEYKRSADWAARKLRDLGLENVHFDRWAPLGKGWSLKNFSAMVTSPVRFPVVAYPAAWSPGFSEKDAEVVYLDVKTEADFAKYKGKLKGKYVLISDLLEVKAHWDPQALRLADSALLKMANADLGRPRRGGRRTPFARFRTMPPDSALMAMREIDPTVDSATFISRLLEMRVGPMKLAFCQDEDALAAVTAGRGDGGNLLVQGASVPQSGPPVPPGPGAPPRKNIYDADAPEVIPQVVFASEQYDRIARMARRGEKVRLEMELEVATAKADSGFNIIGEIPGTDLKNEIVMIGGHFDSWHGGTGATDDGTGVAACYEAMRILKVLGDKYGLHPRRTIRIGLWGAEEEGLIGSREYVSEVFGKREAGEGGGMFGGGGGEVKKGPEYDNFSAYFNHDNGSGRLRGVYLQGNEAARSIFRSWFSAYNDPTAQTISIQNTGGTDHQSFDGINLPGFQFIQDPLEYDSRTHHYTGDVFERVIPDDMKQASTVIAFFAYTAATRDAKFPRKPERP